MSHAMIDVILWTLSGMFVLQQLVSMSRTRAPKRNKLRAPSELCERTGSWKVHAPSILQRQAD